MIRMRRHGTHFMINSVIKAILAPVIACPSRLLYINRIADYRPRLDAASKDTRCLRHRCLQGAGFNLKCIKQRQHLSLHDTHPVESSNVNAGVRRHGFPLVGGVQSLENLSTTIHRPSQPPKRGKPWRRQTNRRCQV